jgi:hypothetical protein
MIIGRKKLRGCFLYPTFTKSMELKLKVIHYQYLDSIPQKEKSEMERSLLDLLRRGGFILYSRHGEATVGEDQPNLNFQYCFTQRNLSEVGRRQAIYYGQILRHLRIPISYPILTSPFCRTIETAQLAFGSSTIQIDPFWFDVYKLSGNLWYGTKKNSRFSPVSVRN